MKINFQDLKIRFFLFLSMSIVVSIGFYSVFQNTQSQYHDLNDKVLVSHHVTEWAWQIHKNKKWTPSEEDLKTAQELKPEHRSTAIQDMFKEPNLTNLEHVIKTETNFREFSKKHLLYKQARLKYLFWTWCFAIFALGVLTFIYFYRSVIVPIQALQNKMDEFLSNQFHFQFLTPTNDEIGRLHNLFNHLAQNVLQQMESLRDLDRAKSEFLSIASHELRTPLTSIKGSLSLMHAGVSGQLPDSTKSLLGIALTETDRLIRIINELLDLAKIEARQFPLRKDWHQPKSLLENCQKNLQGLALAAGVKLQVDFPEHVLANFDLDRTIQVLTNLMSNAIKFSPNGSRVQVKWEVAENGPSRISVIDQGRGIAPEDQKLIFEKFRQATGPDNPLVKGTGLGLAIAKALVEQHGGQIGVESSPGKGSTFYFTLPEWRFEKSTTPEHAA
jgi:signal transduction histidine kinase